MATWKAGNYMNSGLSKAQYLAKQSAPKKSSSTPKSNFSNYVNMGWSAGASAAKKAGIDTSTGSAFDLAMNKKYNPGNYAVLSGSDPSLDSEMGDVTKWSPTNGRASDSKVSDQYKQRKDVKVPTVVNTPQSSNRSLAQQAFNNVMGIQTANAATSPKPINSTSAGWRSALDYGLDIAKNLPGLNAVSNLAKNYGIDYTSVLGIPKEQANTGLQVNLDPAQSELFSSSIENPQNSVSDPGEPSFQQNQFEQIVNSNPQGQRFANDFSKSISKPSSYSTPKPVSNPFIPQPQSTNLSDIISSLSQSQPDYTPAQQTNFGTKRQFLGNGILSNGIASNGKGNYGIEGALTGTDQLQSNPMDDLLSLLGLKIPTAQAAELPAAFTQNVFSQPKNDYTNSSLYQDTINRMYGATNNSELPNQTSQVQGSGGVAQQYAQPSTNAMALMQQQAGGYDQQTKAQKKATDELIRSIKKQYESQINQTNQNYATQETQGKSDLEKAKQADLMQLSGLFNFSANQSPDSEQRIQYQQRAQDQANTNLANFLAKLMAAKNSDITGIQNNRSKDISSAKQQLQQALASISENRAKTQMEIAKMMDAQRKGGSTSAGSITYLGNDANGNPVYYNTKTGQQQVMSGITRPHAQTLAEQLASIGLGNQGQSQGGQFTGKYQNGLPVYIDENGQEYIEQ